jgi:uncharacterized membrane protein YeaQ/YmgE (transglycosylase-associated protein family)
MLGESLAIFLVAGLVTGWLAGMLLQDTGFGAVGDLVIGVIGGFGAGWLLPNFGIQFGGGITSAIVSATLGAVALLVLVRLLRGGNVWRGSPGPSL